MPAAFPRTLRELRRTSRSWWMPLLLALLLVAWIAWSLLARLTVYAVSDSARLEVVPAASPIEAPVDGRITATHIVLGAEVEAGDPLLELDAIPFQLEMAELVAKREGCANELPPFQAEIRAQEEQLQSLLQARTLGDDELAAQIHGEEAALRLAEHTAQRSTELRANQLVAELDFEKAQSDVEQHRAELERRKAARQRGDWDRRAQMSELQAQLEETRQDEARAQREIAVATAAIDRLANEIERRTIRAPASGRLGETVDARVGQFIERGRRLGAIVPAGNLRIVASLRPEDALGRVRVGQSARFRLRGFPWVQYGSIPASVTSLASEALSGSARVELEMARDLAFPVSLQNGLPGRLEIEIEQVSPATLVLRAAGALLAGRP